MVEKRTIVMPAGIRRWTFITRLASKGIAVCIVVPIVGAYNLFTQGLYPRDLTLLCGGIAAHVGLMGYMFLVDAKMGGTAAPGVANMLKAFGGVAPYAFGVYLTFYEGLWGVARLLSGFTVGGLVAASLYLVAGYQLVMAIYQVSELGQAHEDGRVVRNEQ